MRARAAIVIAFLAANLALLARTGVRIGGDTSQYTDAAARLVDGRPLEGVDVTHIGYVAAIAFAKITGAGLIGLVLAQIVLAAVAVVAVYRLGSALATPLAGLIASALVACDVDTWRWHAYALTDSFYISLAVIAVWCVHVAAEQRPGDRRAIAAAVAAIVLAVLVRPEGWLLPPIAATYAVLVRATPRASRRIAPAIAAGCLGAIVVLLVAVPRLHETIDRVVNVETFAAGKTIWGSEDWKVPMPAAATTPERGVSGAMEYVAAHPTSVATLMMARVGVHVAHVRPFYSRAHNMAIVVWLVPVYAFAIIGWRRVARQPLARLAAALIVATTAMAAVSNADWDGRYLVHVIAMVYVFSACGAWGRAPSRLASPVSPYLPDDNLESIR